MKNLAELKRTLVPGVSLKMIGKLINVTREITHAQSNGIRSTRFILTNQFDL